MKVAPLTPLLKRIRFGFRWRNNRWKRESPVFAALYAAGPKHPIPKRMGDNRGCRPVRLGVSQVWVDEITRKLDAGSPTHWQGMLFRVWCPSVTSAKILESLVKQDLSAGFEPMRKDWIDFGPNLDVPALERAIRRVASDHNIKTWTDAEILEHLKWIQNEPERQISRLKQTHSDAYG